MNRPRMRRNHVMKMYLLIAAAMVIATPGRAEAADAEYHHVHITAAAPSEGVKWYTRHLDCEQVADRSDAVLCSGVEVVFVPQPTLGTSQGTGVREVPLLRPLITLGETAIEDLAVRERSVIVQPRIAERNVEAFNQTSGLVRGREGALGRAYLEWLVTSHHEYLTESLPPIPLTSDRPGHNTAVLEYGWRLLHRVQSRRSRAADRYSARPHPC